MGINERRKHPRGHILWPGMERVWEIALQDTRCQIRNAGIDDVTYESRWEVTGNQNRPGASGRERLRTLATCGTRV